MDQHPKIVLDGRSQVRLVESDVRLAWEALVDDTDSSVAIVDRDGLLLYANKRVLRGLGLDDSEALTGRSLQEFFPADFVEERLGFMRQAIRSGRPITVVGICFGHWSRAVYRPISSIAGIPRVLCVCRASSESDCAEVSDEGGEVVRAKVHDRGALATLTDRELEVLRLIGQGLSTAQIGEKLHRSVKTIEWHRVALGAKLGVKSRVELARIALGAGLSNFGESDGRLPL